MARNANLSDLRRALDQVGASPAPLQASQRGSTPSASPVRDWAVTAAVTAQLVAGVLHLVLTPTHLAEALGTGLFFVGIGASQTMWSVAVLRSPFRWQAEWGIVLALVPLILYGITRVFQNPFTGEAEGVDAVGILTDLAEAVVVIAMVGVLVSERARLPLAGRLGRAAVSILIGVALAGAVYAAGYAAIEVVPSLGEGSNGHEHHEDGHATLDAPTTRAFALIGPLESAGVLQALAWPKPRG